jgi:hypothetical protein
MHDETSRLEAELLKLRPVGSNGQLIDRLEACALGEWSELLDDEVQFENKLRANTPARLNPALMASLEAICSTIPFPQEKNIVGFPNFRSQATKPSRRPWAAAAAIAVIGAITALLVPMKDRPASSTSSIATPNNAVLTPASFKRGLTSASDEGVVWQSNQRPHRVLKLTYQDCATLRDEKGRTYEVEQPRVEYVLVPAKTD